MFWFLLIRTPRKTLFVKLSASFQVTFLSNYPSFLVCQRFSTTLKCNRSTLIAVIRRNMQVRGSRPFGRLVLFFGGADEHEHLRSRSVNHHHHHHHHHSTQPLAYIHKKTIQ